MKILLIDCHYYKKQAANKKSQRSLTLMQLAALTPEKYDITALDGPKSIDYDENYDLVAISAVTPAALDAYNIADEFRKRGVKVVIGGWHASLLPYEAKKHSDAVFIGEAEKTWPQFLEDFERNEIKDFYKQEKSIPLGLTVEPKRNIFKNKKQLATIEEIRGCSVGCEFCCISNNKFKRKPQFKPIENAINEIKNIPQKYLYFCGPSITSDIEYTKKLFFSIKKLNKKFSCYGNINELEDDYLLSLARDAGCTCWIIGFESVCQDTIDMIGKYTNMVSEYKNTIEKIHRYNMSVIGSFVFGFDYDTPDVFDKTYEFIDQIDIDLPIFIILTPYPGTPLFERLERENRILTKDWSRYNLREAVFRPKNMTPEFLEIGVKKLYNRFYSFEPIMKRTLKSANRGYYQFKISVINNFRGFTGKRIHEYLL